MNLPMIITFICVAALWSAFAGVKAYSLRQGWPQ
jgi:hypothetical protein